MKLILRYTAFLTVLIILILIAQNILMLKWQFEDSGYITEWQNEYRDLKKDSVDVLVLGSSNAYTSYNPILVYEETGINSFVLAGPDQTLKASLNVLKESFKTQSPAVIVLELYAIDMQNKMDETRLHQIYDTRLLSLEKIAELEELRFENDKLVDLLIPIFRYHTRWEELTKLDYTYLTNIDAFALKGFEARGRANEIPFQALNSSNTPPYLSDENEAMLDDILSLCKENNAQLLLYKAPSASWSQQSSSNCHFYANQNDLHFIDFNMLSDEFSFNSKHDFDDDKHLNYIGAHKTSSYLGNFLIDNFEIDTNNTQEDDEEWQAHRAFYNQHINAIKLKNAQNLEEYLPLLNNEAYTVCFVRTEHPQTENMDVAIIESMSDYGLGALLALQNLAVQNDGTIETWDKLTQHLNYNGNAYSISADKASNIFGVKFEYDDITPDFEGDSLIITVYDNIMGQIVDSVSFNLSNLAHSPLR